MTRTSPIIGVAVATTLLVGAAAGLQSAIDRYKLVIRKEPIQARNGRLLSALPTETESWVRIGTDHIESAEVLETLGTQNYLTRNFIERNPKDRARPIVLSLHTAYYTGMIDTVPHVPDRCFVGGGMQIGEIIGNLPLNLLPENLADSTWREVPGASKLPGRIFTIRTPGGQYPHSPRDPDKIELRTMKFLDKGQNPVFAGYFFIANGGHVCLAEQVRLLAFDLNSTYAYYVKVQVTSDSVSSGEELARAASSLIGELLGDIMLCTPDWVEVERGEYPVRAAPEPATSGKT